MSGGGDNYDFCEYVYNPLMRQYQAMIRLMNMLRDSGSQSDCNDIQCFTNPNDPSNPMTSLNSAGSSASFLTTYLPMIAVWSLFVFALFMLRPNSMRNSSNKEPSKSNGQNNGRINNRFFDPREDDDDNSTVS